MSIEVKKEIVLDDDNGEGRVDVWNSHRRQQQQEDEEGEEEEEDDGILAEQLAALEGAKKKLLNSARRDKSLREEVKGLKKQNCKLESEKESLLEKIIQLENRLCHAKEENQLLADKNKEKDAQLQEMGKVTELENKLRNYKEQNQMLADENKEKEAQLQKMTDEKAEKELKFEAELKGLKKAHQKLQKNYMRVRTLNEKRLSVYKATFYKIMDMEDDGEMESVNSDESSDNMDEVVTNSQARNGFVNIYRDTEQKTDRPVRQSKKPRRNMPQVNYQQRSHLDDLEIGQSSSGSDPEYIPPAPKRYKLGQRKKGKPEQKRKKVKNVNIPDGVLIKSTCGPDRVFTLLKTVCHLFIHESEENIYQQLTCRDTQKMASGQAFILEALTKDGKPYFYLKHERCGFDIRMSKTSWNSRSKDSWQHLLIRLNKDSSGNYQFAYLRWHSLVVKKPGEQMHINKCNAIERAEDFPSRRFYTVLNKENIPYTMDESAPYLHVRVRRSRLCMADNIEMRVNQVQVVEAFNVPRAEKLPGRVAVSFMGGTNEDRRYYDMGKYLPHPTVHDNKCKEYTGDQEVQEENEGSDEEGIEEEEENSIVQSIKQE